MLPHGTLAVTTEEHMHHTLAGPISDSSQLTFHRINMFRKFGRKKSVQRELELEVHKTPRANTRACAPLPFRLPSAYGIRGDLPDVAVSEQFSNLRKAIVSHVRRCYTKSVDRIVPQSLIENACTGITLPRPQIANFLADTDTRMATLVLCIAWTILSRSLLLKLGITSSPGSTFLPPELVECFQSFSIGNSPWTLGRNEDNSVNYALLSRWKQISATLLHSTYETHAFSHFDPRTVNIERALQDLDPLLITNALASEAGSRKDARIEDLRNVLRQGAKFAFTLFGQSSFWKFDWTSDRAIQHGKPGNQGDETPCGLDDGVHEARKLLRLTPHEIVLWPRLLRVMDAEGHELDNQSGAITFGEKSYLTDF